jgi:hypothetical protein
MKKLILSFGLILGFVLSSNANNIINMEKPLPVKKLILKIELKSIESEPTCGDQWKSRVFQLANCCGEFLSIENIFTIADEEFEKCIDETYGEVYY